MTKKQKQAEFLEKLCNSNEMWVAQMLLQNLTPNERSKIVTSLRKLKRVLYKSWARDMTLNELVDAIDMIP